MRENDWNELEELLADSLPDLPPEEIVRSVTPWRRAMDRVLTGSALRAVTLSLFGLQYLLPALGTLLLLLGYRALRRENRFFSHIMRTLRVPETGKFRFPARFFRHFCPVRRKRRAFSDFNL